MNRYERFEAWQRCHELVLAIYHLTKRFPTDERYGLTSQARRAAFSAAANIVEGSAKRGPAEFRRFLDISLGSLAEVSYVIRLAKDLGYADRDVVADVKSLHDRAFQTTWGLYRSLRIK